MALTIDDSAIFPEDLDPGVEWGPAWLTVVITTGAGFEQRNQQWSRPRRQGNLGVTLHTEVLKDTFVSFFEARGGRLRGFRLKDPKDYTVTDEPLTHAGATTVQLTRTYTSGGVTRVRPIYKPITGTVTLKVNGSAYTTFAIDYNSGTIYLAAALGGGDVLTWSGQYHIPVRFDSDLQTLTHHSPTWSEWQSIPLIELRGAPTPAIPVISDTFTRANGAIGNTETGEAWTNSLGTVFEVASNRAVATTIGTNPIAHVQGITTGRRVKATLYSNGSPSSPGVAIRVVDHLNMIFLTRESGNFKILSLNAGTFGLVADGGAIALPEGDVYELQAVGNTINAYRNGLLVTSGTSALHSTATRYGITVGAGVNSVDSFSVT